jgi:hypothetical protein
MSPSAELACVDPAFVAQIWPHTKYLIRGAMVRADIGLFAPVEADVLAGRALLWVVTDGRRIAAALVTQLARTERRKVCVIVACGGADMRLWLHLIGGIEQHARDEGCDAIRVIGRLGWARALRTYRIKRAIIEKELS